MAYMHFNPLPAVAAQSGQLYGKPENGLAAAAPIRSVPPMSRSFWFTRMGQPEPSATKTIPMPLNPKIPGPPGNLWVGEAPDGPLMNTTAKTANLSRPSDRRAAARRRPTSILPFDVGIPLNRKAIDTEPRKATGYEERRHTQPVPGKRCDRPSSLGRDVDAA